MMSVDLPIVGPSYHLKDWSIDCQRTLNLYPQVVESGTAPQVSALLPTEGLTKLYEFVGESQQYAAKVRGLYALTDRVLVVVSMRLVVIQDGQWRDIGYLRGLDKVTFADNGIEVFMTGNDEYGFTGHVYNIKEDTLKEIEVDPDTKEQPEDTPHTQNKPMLFAAGLVTSIKPEKESIEMLLADGDKEIKVTVSPADATDKTYTATSSDTAIATVAITSTGIKIMPVAYGEVTITLKANDASGAEAKVKVKVTFAGAVTKIIPATFSLQMNIETPTVDVGVTVLPENATNKTYTATSSNTGIVTVEITSSGLKVTCLKQGDAKITLTTQDGSNISVEIKVVVSGNGFFGASSVTFLDSRFIWSVPNTGQIQWSGLLNHKTDALSYATAESRSDNLIRVIANNGMLWLIGEKTTEVWISTGDKDSPFVRQSGAYIPTGCLAKDSIVEFGSSLIWLSQTDFGANQIVMTEGYQTKRISNHALESALARYESTEDAYAWSYQHEGHAFYVISFPTDRKTWCYDASTQMWHERSWYNTDNSNHEHHRAYCHCYFKGQHLVGDREFPYIYKLDAEAETDNGAVIIRERTTPCLNAHATRKVFDEVELVCQVGQDNNTKPTIMLDWSDDRGKTWSNDRVVEIAKDIGAIGEYEKRVIFRRLGQSFGRVFRVRMTDAGRLIILGAKAKIR